jgi:uncharacterized protein
MSLDPTLPLNLLSPAAPPSERVKRSMYTRLVDNEDGYHLLYNVLLGALLKVPSASVDFLEGQSAWEAKVTDLNPFQNLLLQAGFLVRADIIEQYRSRLLYDERYRSERRLELILLPHENCNFRCVYCYETFSRNKMEPWVRTAIMKFVTSKLPSYSSFSVSWFGGEPTLAPDVIHELSRHFVGLSTDCNIPYNSSITTNGYNLTETLARSLIEVCKITQFQITLDGPSGSHNRKRRLVSGAGTFDKIYNNVLGLRGLKGTFRVILRINYDGDSASELPGFIDQLATDFASDGRFAVHPFPISNWGGNDVASLPLCDVNVARALRFDLLKASADHGFSSLIGDQIRPTGSVCYAADPNSYIIGSDGQIYKCTVAFEDPRNQVGHIRADGQMSIDRDKFAHWVLNQGVLDSGCQSCFFNPACHGMTCPLYRMQTEQSPCPPFKVDFPDALRILGAELEKQKRVMKV